MGSHLDSDVRIVGKKLHKLVESLFRLRPECSLIEIIKDILDNIGLIDTCEDKIDLIFGIFLGIVGCELLLCIEITAATGHHDVTYAALKRE